MRRECRKFFPLHRLQRKPLVSDLGMRHGTCVTHMPWYMAGLLTRGGGENVPGIPGACANRDFTRPIAEAQVLLLRFVESSDRLERVNEKTKFKIIICYFEMASWNQWSWSLTCSMCSCEQFILCTCSRCWCEPTFMRGISLMRYEKKKKNK